MAGMTFVNPFGDLCANEACALTVAVRITDNFFSVRSLEIDFGSGSAT